MDTENADDSKYRVSLQAALRFTLIDKISTTAGQFATRANISESTLSEFMNNRRSINLSTFEAFVAALTREQYDYFLAILTDGRDMLRTGEHGEQAPTSELLEDEDHFRDTFFALVASYCYKCNKTEQLDLLTVIYEASSQNPALTSQDK